MCTLRFLLTGLLAVLSPAIATAQTPKNGGTLTYAVTAEAPSTDCHAITTYAAVHVLAPHYSLLLKVDPDNYPKLKPDVAESWTVSPTASPTPSRSAPASLSTTAHRSPPRT
jgi:peptide/nickel transport system substrate-binding protein